MASTGRLFIFNHQVGSMAYQHQKTMKQIIADKNLVAFCGLYCGACKKYLEERCPGCRENEKACWCKVRQCCMSSKLETCADCKTFADVNDCKKMNNCIAKIFAFIFRSDRRACINRIKDIGEAAYAQEMTDKKQMSIKS